MILAALQLALAADPGLVVDPSRAQPLSLGLPAVGTTVRYAVEDRQAMRRLGAEVLARAALDLRVEAADRGGRALIVRDRVAGRVVQTDFGLADPEAVAALPSSGPVLRWTLDRHGELLDVATVDGDDPAGALGATLAASVGYPRPPQGARPGDTWTVDRAIDLPIQVEDVRVALHLALDASYRFVGWTEVDGRWLPRIDVEGTVELTGAMPGTLRDGQLGAMARMSAIVVLDPDDGLPVWTSRRTRIALAAGAEDRPTELQELQVLWRLPAGG